jgi:hypothetical protein
MIRICFLTLFLLVVLPLLGIIVFSSSAITPEQAVAIYARINEATTRPELEKMIGKPHRKIDVGGTTYLCWDFFAMKSLNEADSYGFNLYWKEDGKLHFGGGYRGIASGSDAWVKWWEFLREGHCFGQ